MGATTLQVQSEELGIEKGHVSTIKNEQSGSGSNSLLKQLSDTKRIFQADIKRIEQEFQVQFKVQEAENVRLQQQVTQLKGEKTSIHQQIVTLQHRIEELEEEIGHE